MKQIDSEKKLDRLKIDKLLKTIYSNHTTEEINFISNQLLQILDDFSEKSAYEEIREKERWNESHSVLITYADSIYKNGEATLITLRKLLSKHFGSLSKVVHILPFLKSTSDGGFAVSSYDSLEEKFGSWDDLKSISKNHDLMADLVLNHVSSSHPWVQQFIKSQEPGISNVFSPKQNLDWSNVVRPRSSSLFSQINTDDGLKQVWTTFGPDQIDLNWHNPKMTLEFLNLITTYLSNGIKWLRLDAVGFIWKESGTTCLHLPKAHSIVKLLRVLLNNLLDDGVLITETNVPQKENLSYLISDDEAHMAYNFPLPPLLLEAIITSRADILNSWIFDWPKLPEDTTLFNFTASHDGVGLRALEGLMNEQRIKDLLINCEKRGGLVSHRRLSNGEDKPYELNISWWSAMEDSSRDAKRFQYERFILSQVLVMALKGVPAFYLPALLASENDIKSFSMTGQRRDLNREKFKSENLSAVLNNPESNANKNLKYLRNAMDVRSELKQFHPCSQMKCLSKGRSDIVVIKRGKGPESVFAIHNMTENKINYQLNDNDLPKIIDNDFNTHDFLTSTKYNCKNISLDPFQVIWLSAL
ncbi:putative sucrose phosphorylase [Prochlorococcus marinus str. MIT 9321]|uniref:Putative sucrose phosphorylase n=1 Tax=Prochlorococcus marinus str. MIT 9401 TaxID=167551 RepID=A0A0A2B1U8_PROMR|nr:sugar phosphorylase [Prochlorococcus marinus]KGG04431.1 putative sucrose phosphorylase [Prochlorococcus marinus str. MIT 9322]KGG05114.1 putative sucrose phosphorylase [Prochlorococcus marinus str. MIT 9321]KGG07112.1 putative sucrose phosphorylase [Prochlorococcus marinus str. MIT 9401]